MTSIWKWRWIVSIPINNLDSSVFYWRGKRVNEERAQIREMVCTWGNDVLTGTEAWRNCPDPAGETLLVSSKHIAPARPPRLGKFYMLCPPARCRACRPIRSRACRPARGLLPRSLAGSLPGPSVCWRVCPLAAARNRNSSASASALLCFPVSCGRLITRLMDELQSAHSILQSLKSSPFSDTLQLE